MLQFLKHKQKEKIANFSCVYGCLLYPQFVRETLVFLTLCSGQCWIICHLYVKLMATYRILYSLMWRFHSCSAPLFAFVVCDLWVSRDFYSTPVPLVLASIIICHLCFKLMAACKISCTLIWGGNLCSALSTCGSAVTCIQLQHEYLHSWSFEFLPYKKF